MINLNQNLPMKLKFSFKMLLKSLNIFVICNYMREILNIYVAVKTKSKL